MLTSDNHCPLPVPTFCHYVMADGKAGKRAPENTSNCLLNFEPFCGTRLQGALRQLCSLHTGPTGATAGQASPSSMAAQGHLSILASIQSPVAEGTPVLAGQKLSACWLSPGLLTAVWTQ